MRILKNIALSDTGFLFNPSTGDSYSVNEIGKKIINLLQEGKEDEEIIKAILENYRIDKSSVEKDLYDFKNMLLAYKLAE